MSASPSLDALPPDLCAWFVRRYCNAQSDAHLWYGLFLTNKTWHARLASWWKAERDPLALAIRLATHNSEGWTMTWLRAVFARLPAERYASYVMGVDCLEAAAVAHLNSPNPRSWFEVNRIKDMWSFVFSHGDTLYGRYEQLVQLEYEIADIRNKADLAERNAKRARLLAELGEEEAE